MEEQINHFFFSRKILILHNLFEHFLWKVTKITVTYVAEIRTQELKRQYNSFNYKSNVQTLCGTQIMHWKNFSLCLEVDIFFETYKIFMLLFSLY